MVLQIDPRQGGKGDNRDAATVAKPVAATHMLLQRLPAVEVYNVRMSLRWG